MKKLISHIDENDVKCSTFSYKFYFKNALEDLNFIAPNGYIAIKEEITFPIEEPIKSLFMHISEENDNFEIQGATTDGSRGELYIIHLTQEHFIMILNMLQDLSDNISAYWISYFIDNEIIVDIGHANHGCTEQICFSHKVDESKIEKLQTIRKFKLIK